MLQVQEEMLRITVNFSKKGSVISKYMYVRVSVCERDVLNIRFNSLNLPNIIQDTQIFFVTIKKKSLPQNFTKK